MAEIATVHSHQLDKAEAERWLVMHKNMKSVFPVVIWEGNQWLLTRCDEFHGVNGNIAGYIFRLQQEP